MKKLKCIKKLKSKIIRSNDYLIITIALILLFILGLIYVVTSENTLTCYYKENFNISCKTCGITRDFKSIIQLKFNELINPLSTIYFGMLNLFFMTRLIIIILISRKINIKKIIYFDIVLGIILLLTNFIFHC